MRIISRWLTMAIARVGQRRANPAPRSARIFVVRKPAPRLLSFVLLLGLVVALGSPVVQAGLPDYTREPAPSAVVVRRVSLIPDSSAADTRATAAIEFIQYANGAIEIAGSVTYDGDGPPLVIEYDLEHKTYGFRSPTADEGLPGPAAPSGDSASAPAPDQLATITKSARARVVVRDPVNIVVNETTNGLQWYIYDNGTVGAKSHTDNCYANPKTPINTVWFTKFCDQQASILSSDRKSILNKGQGNYENWNWIDPNIGTWSYTTVNLLGFVSGSYTSAWNCTLNGENGSFLKCQIYLN